MRAKAIIIGLLALVLVLLLCAPRAAVPECVSATAASMPQAVVGDSTLETLRLVLNAPAFRLNVFENGVPTGSHGVAVGARKYPTPRGSFSITAIEWNPWWIPPPAEWAKRDTVTPPGPKNPMGRVKLYFQPLYFVHGTPAEMSIGSAASHGCVRMRNEDVIALARLVQRYAAPHVTDVQVDSLLVHYERTRRVTLVQPVPLEIRYDLVEISSDSLFVYRDIYSLARGTTLDSAVVLVARTFGVEPAQVNRDSLRAAVRRSSRGTTAISLSALR